MGDATDSMEMFGLVCGTVANMIDEEGLSNEEALKVLRRTLLPDSTSAEVISAISRLEELSHGRELWQPLREEWEKAARRLANRNLRYASSLFG